MALAPPNGMFAGEEIGEYETPNGRVMLPASVAAALGMSSPSPPPGAIPGAPQNLALGAAPPAPMGARGPIAPPPPIAAPMVQPASEMPPIDPAPTSMLPEGKTPAPRPVAAPPDAPAPKAKPTSAADLRAGGYGSVLDQQNAALEQAAKAGEADAAEQAALLEQRAMSREAANAEFDKIAEQKAKDADARLEAINQKQANVDASIETLASTPLDRRVDHPILAAIGLVLSGIGAAMEKKSENPAFKVLMQQLDRKIAAQVADREKQGQVIGLKRGQIDGLRQQLTDRNAYYDGLMATEVRKLDSKIAEIADRSSSQTVKANAQKLRTDLALKGSEFRASAMDKQIAKDDREAQAKAEAERARAQQALGWAGIAEQRRGREESMKFQRDQFEYSKKKDADVLALEEKKLLAAGQGKAAAQVRELGIGGVATAVKDKDDNVIGIENKPLTNKDGSLFQAGSPQEAIALRSKKAAVDSIVTMLDEVSRLRTKYGWSSNLFNSKEYQQMKANWSALTLENKELYKLGAISGTDKDLIDGFLGTDDPTKIKDPGAGIAQARKNTLMAFNNAANSHVGNDVDYAPVDTGSVNTTPNDRREATADISSAKTPRAVAAGQKVGAVRGAIEYATGGGILYNNAEERAKISENAGSTKYPYGFSPKSDASIDTLLAAYKGSDKAAAKDAKQRLLDLAASGRGEDQAAGLSLLRNEAKDLYNEALAKMPTADRANVQAADAAKIRLRTAAELESAAIAGDSAATSELTRRVQERDRDAVAAAHRVAMALRSRK